MYLMSAESVPESSVTPHAKGCGKLRSELDHTATRDNMSDYDCHVDPTGALALRMPVCSTSDGVCGTGMPCRIMAPSMLSCLPHVVEVKIVAE